MPGYQKMRRRREIREKGRRGGGDEAGGEVEMKREEGGRLRVPSLFYILHFTQFSRTLI